MLVALGKYAKALQSRSVTKSPNGKYVADGRCSCAVGLDQPCQPIYITHDNPSAPNLDEPVLRKTAQSARHRFARRVDVACKLVLRYGNFCCARNSAMLEHVAGDALIEALKEHLLQHAYHLGVALHLNLEHKGLNVDIIAGELGAHARRHHQKR